MIPVCWCCKVIISAVRRSNGVEINTGGVDTNHSPTELTRAPCKLSLSTSFTPTLPLKFPSPPQPHSVLPNTTPVATTHQLVFTPEPDASVMSRIETGRYVQLASPPRFRESIVDMSRPARLMQKNVPFAFNQSSRNVDQRPGFLGILHRQEPAPRTRGVVLHILYFGGRKRGTRLPGASVDPKTTASTYNDFLFRRRYTILGESFGCFQISRPIAWRNIRSWHLACLCPA